MMKDYEVTITLKIVEYKVKARNKNEAKRKALERLNRTKPSNLISKKWPSMRKDIEVDDYIPVFRY